jgi:hypothetical protein
MTIADDHGRVIEIDVQADPLPVDDRRVAARFVPVVVALVIGVLIGMAADRQPGGTPVPVPAPRMHTVVVTEDGRSETFTMPSGSTVTTPAVTSSCSITIDGKFADFVSRVVGDAECGVVVP